VGRMNYGRAEANSRAAAGEQAHPWDPNPLKGPSGHGAGNYGLFTLASLCRKARGYGIPAGLAKVGGMGSYAFAGVEPYKLAAAELEPGPTKGMMLLLCEIRIRWPRMGREGRVKQLERMRRSLQALESARKAKATKK